MQGQAWSPTAERWIRLVAGPSFAPTPPTPPPLSSLQQAAPAVLASSSSSIGLPPPHEFTFFCEPRHDETPTPGTVDSLQQQQPQGAGGQQQQQGGGLGLSASIGSLSSGGGGGSSEGLVSKWRQKERLKTTAVALVMCLNIGAVVVRGGWGGVGGSVSLYAHTHPHLAPPSPLTSHHTHCTRPPVAGRRRRPARCHQDLALRPPRVLGGPAVHAGAQGPRHHRLVERSAAWRPVLLGAGAGASWAAAGQLPITSCGCLPADLLLPPAKLLLSPAPHPHPLTRRQEPAGAVRALAAAGQVQDAPGPHH